MLMKKLYPIVLLMLLLVSFTQGCKKKDDGLPDIITDTTAYLGIYQPTGIKMLDDVVMYTNGGVVTDAATIQSFLNRRSYLSDFDFANDSVSYNANLRIYFETGGGVIFISGVNDTVRAAKVSESATEMIVGRRDTTIVQVTPFTETPCDSLYRLAMKAKPWRQYFNNYPPPTGTDPGVRMQTRYLIEVNNGNYTLPLMNIATLNTANGCSRLFTGIWNAADVGSLNGMDAGDTVVVQVGRVKLRKL